jgi:hypothetical protein
MRLLSNQLDDISLEFILQYIPIPVFPIQVNCETDSSGTRVYVEMLGRSLAVSNHSVLSNVRIDRANLCECCSRRLVLHDIDPKLRRLKYGRVVVLVDDSYEDLTPGGEGGRAGVHGHDLLTQCDVCIYSNCKGERHICAYALIQDCYCYH